VDPASAARVLAVVVSGLVGLMVGSFLNVVVHRVPRGMSVVRPASHCPSCGTELAARDNVPLASWLLLRGRCRHCRAPISPRYPLVELATGGAFLGMALAIGPDRALPSLLLVLASAVAAGAVDLDGPPVPWSVDVAGGLGALSLVVVAATAGQAGRLGWAALGFAASGVAALSADRSCRGTRRAVAVAVLGWSAGWLWAPGGLLLAAWVLAVALGAALGARRGRGEPTDSEPVGDVGGRSALPLVAVAVGAFGLLLAGAVLTATP
jgi:leader peptidase (prepilin peptidase)/N-methyltransferase